MPVLSKVAKASKKAAAKAEKVKARQKKAVPRDVRKGGANYGKVGAAAAAGGAAAASMRDGETKAEASQKKRVNRTEKELKKLGY